MSRQALEKKGVIKDLKARLRADVYQCLEDKSVKMPEKPADVFLATELIRELLITPIVFVFVTSLKVWAS